MPNEPELHLFQFEMLLESLRSPEVRNLVKQMYADYLKTVEAALKKQGPDTGNEAAIAIFAALDGPMLQFLTISEPEKIRAAVVHIGRLVSALRPTGSLRDSQH